MFFERHRALLEQALAAYADRGWWSAYPESTKPYAETRAAQDAAYQALLGQRFETGQGAEAWVGAEVSPFGPALGVTYPAASAETLMARAVAAGPGWAGASVEDRVGVCLEVLHRLNQASQLIAHAVSATTGQAPPMAFQAGGPHAQERGLEAVVLAYAEMMRVPARARWEKPAGRTTLVLNKTWRIVPRGVGLVIGCATFPTWNLYPGLFASLATGNAVIAKPHPGAILPVAITVQIGRAVLAEAGFDPDLLQLAPDTAAAPVTQALASHPGVGIIDYTGGTDFGDWLRVHAGALLFTEEAGANPVVIDGASDFPAMCQNLAFSLCLYSGQMCTTPQNLFVPSTGIAGHSFDAVVSGIVAAVDGLLADAGRAAAVLGAIASPATLERVAQARSLGRVARESAALEGEARTATPLILVVDAADQGAFAAERFGPISFIVRTRDTAQSIEIAADGARVRGAITAGLYATEEAVIERAAAVFGAAGAALSVNLLGGIYVNQSAAWSDFHVSGLNPSGNACLTDPAFIAGRFRVAQMRRAA